MIQNPKQTVTIDYAIEKVIETIKRIPILDTEYKEIDCNEMMKKYVLKVIEVLNGGWVVNIILNETANLKTEITVEVQRGGFGLFSGFQTIDTPYEASAASARIDKIFKTISEILLNPGITELSFAKEERLKNEARVERERAEALLPKKIQGWGGPVVTVISWILGLLMLGAAAYSKVPIVNICIAALFILPSIYRGIKKNF